MKPPTTELNIRQVMDQISEFTRSLLRKCEDVLVDLAHHNIEEPRDDAGAGIRLPEIKALDNVILVEKNSGRKHRAVHDIPLCKPDGQHDLEQREANDSQAWLLTAVTSPAYGSLTTPAYTA